MLHNFLHNRELEKYAASCLKARPVKAAAAAAAAASTAAVASAAAQPATPAATSGRKDAQVRYLAIFAWLVLDFQLATIRATIMCDFLPVQAKKEELEKRLEDVQKTLGGDAKAKRAAKAASKGNAANVPGAANPSAPNAANAADSSSSSDSDSSNSSSSSSDSDSDSESETSPTKKSALAAATTAQQHGVAAAAAKNAAAGSSNNISVRRDLMPGANPQAVPAGASLLNLAATAGSQPPAVMQHSQQQQQQLARGDSVDGGPTKTKAALKGEASEITGDIHFNSLYKTMAEKMFLQHKCGGSPLLNFIWRCIRCTRDSNYTNRKRLGYHPSIARGIIERRSRKKNLLIRLLLCCYDR